MAVKWLYKLKLHVINIGQIFSIITTVECVHYNNIVIL